jgi:hypothetical protein
MGTLANLIGGKPAVTSAVPGTLSSTVAPQFSSPTANQMLQQLLASYGQQSIAPQPPGAQQGTSAAPQMGNGGQPASALSQINGLLNKGANSMGVSGLSGFFGPTQAAAPVVDAAGALGPAGSAIAPGAADAGSGLLAFLGL